MTATDHTSGLWRRLLAFALFAFVLLTALAIASSSKAAIESPPPPQVWSDKADYAPGEQVTLSGANWAPGEAVHIRVNDDAGETWRRDVDVTAAEDGTISDQFNLPNWFVATYTVTATGASSGTVTWSFTDSNPNAITVTPASVTVAPGGTAGYTVQVSFNGNATPCTVNLSVSGLPSGASASFLGGNSVSGAGGETPSKTLNVSTTSGTPPASSTLTVSGTQGTGCNGSGPTSGTTTLVVVKRVGTVTVGAQSGTLTFGTASSASYLVTVNRNGATGTAFSANLSVTTSLPTGATASFSPATVNFAAGDTSKTSTLTINTSSATPAGAVAFTVQASNTASAGDAETGNGTLTVNKADSTTTVSCPASVAYDGTAQEPCTASVGGAGGLNQSLSVSYSNNTNAGTANASASYAGDANHNGSNDSETFEIEKADSTTTVSCPASVAYDGTAQEPCTASVSGAGGLNQSLSVSYSNNTNAGTANASASYADDANHNGSSDSETFTIAKRSVTASISAEDKTYDGTDDATISDCSLEAQTGDHGVVSPDDVDCAASNAHFEDANAGEDKTVTADVALVGDDKDNYVLTSTTASTTATIEKADSTTTVSCPASVTYDGTAQEPCTASVSGAGGLNQSLSVSYSNNTNAGTANASASYADDANHNGSSDSETFTIAKADLDLYAVGDSKVYDATTDSSGEPLVAGLKGSDTVTGLAQRFQSKNVLGSGNSTLEIVNGYSVNDGNSGGNYDVATHPEAGTITKAPLDVNAVSDSKVYDGTRASSGVPTVSGLKGSDTVTGREQKFESKNVMGTNGSTLEVTAYTVNDGNSGGNYDVATHPEAGTITKKNLTVTGITASNKVWDGNTNATLNVSGASLVGVVSGDTVSLNTGGAVGTFATSAVGTWNVAISGLTISGGDSGNYSLTQPTTTASITAWSALGYGFYAPVGVANSIFTPAPASAPVSNPGEAWNTAKGGSTVPLKFNVFAGSVEKTNLADIRSFQSSKLATCSGGTLEDPVETLATTGGTSLRYDGTGGQWIQNWKTPSVTGDTCYRAWVTFADGSSIEAFFKLKR